MNYEWRSSVPRRAAAAAGAGGGAMTEAPQPHGGAPPTSHGATAPGGQLRETAS